MVIWAHIRDLHVDPSNSWKGPERLSLDAAEPNEPIGERVDFDSRVEGNANHDRSQEFARMLAGLAPLTLAWRTIPGDHDFGLETLVAYEAALPPENCFFEKIVAGHRYLFLDIVSVGPDLRLSKRYRRRLAPGFECAAAEEQPSRIVMHAITGDLVADGDPVARAIADGGAAFVEIGHTLHNELLNAGHTFCGATRSLAQVEEGPPGYSLVTVRNGVAHWHVREDGDVRPPVRLLAPADQRVITRPADPLQVSRLSPNANGGEPS